MMVINWERIGRITGKFFLWFLEYCIKLSAFVVTAVVLAADGSFGAKLGTGFASISPSLRKLFEAPGDISEAASVVHDYNTMTASMFNEQYGADAIHGVLAYLDGGIIYFQTVLGNLGSQPFATFFAAMISFWSLYFISLVLRFARQKGQGSYFNKLERKLSDRIYATSRKLTRPPSQQPLSPDPKTAAAASASLKTNGVKSNGSAVNTNGATTSNGTPVRTKKKSPGTFKEAQKTNKYLQNYMRSVQNG